MKKLLVVVLLLSLLLVTPALAASFSISVDTGKCEQVSIAASHRFGGFWGSKRVRLFVDGNQVATKQQSGGAISISVSWSGSLSSGNHTATAKAYVNGGLVHTINSQFQVDACYVLCSETVKVRGPWTEWVLVGTEWVRTRLITWYDAQDSEYVCKTKTRTQRRDAIGGCMNKEAENYNPDAEYDDGSCEYYRLCSETVTVIGEWSEWSLEDDVWVRHRVVELFDSRNPEEFCNSWGEHEIRDAVFGCTDPDAGNYNPDADVDDGSCAYPKPVCPLQLLISYSPPEGWLSYCMVLTGGAVSVERQPAICGWVADNQPCGGMVYDDGTEEGQWDCDRYGYYRQPISVLKCLWQRHLSGQRDQASFDKCHGR